MKRALSVQQVIQYYYWIDDRHSHELDAIHTWYARESKKLSGEESKTLHGRPYTHFVLIESFLRLPDEHAAPIRASVAFLDVSRTSGDLACPLSQLEWNEAGCTPYILTLNGRSYDGATFKTAVEKTLVQGQPLRLEDMTIEPEQLHNVELYPNASLGAPPDATPLKFNDRAIAIVPFDDTIGLESKPEFWIDATRPCGHDSGLWNMAAAAVKHGFSTRIDENVVVVRNQRCVQQRFMKEHPKMNHGVVIFRNCLFERCEIDVDCWCGPRFHGCLFLNCIFRFHGMHMCENKAKLCDVWYGAVYDDRKPSVTSEKDMVTFLQRHIGKRTCIFSLGGRMIEYRSTIGAHQEDEVDEEEEEEEEEKEKKEKEEDEKRASSNANEDIDEISDVD